MNSDPKQKWNRIYSSDSAPGTAAAVLTQHLELLPDTGRALDIACGTGANAILLAQRGLDVDAWDVSDVVITALRQHAGDLSISPRCLDITADDLSEATWDVIINCHYLDRSILPAIRRALRPGGLVFIQTFTRDKVVSTGPSNPRFLLARDELLSFAEGMEVLHYQDESENPDTNHPLAGRACLIARLSDAGTVPYRTGTP